MHLRIVILFATLLLAILLGGLNSMVVAEEIVTCPAIGKAGERTVYRCVDEEEGTLIYSNDLGFMFVLEW